MNQNLTFYYSKDHGPTELSTYLKQLNVLLNNVKKVGNGKFSIKYYNVLLYI